jgi:hypothetical protein
MILIGDPEDYVRDWGSDEPGGSCSPVAIFREEQILIG